MKRISFQKCGWSFLLTMVVLCNFVGFAPAFAEAIDRILATVNESMITQSDVKTFQDKLAKGELVDDNLIPDEATRSRLIKDADKALENLIEARLIDSEVKKQGINIPMEQVEQEIRSNARERRMTVEQFKAVLEARKMKYSDYQAFVKTGLARQTVIGRNVTSKIKVSEDDVVAALVAEGKNVDNQAAEYSLAQILFLNKKRGAEVAKARAQEAYEKLRAGGAFDRVAADFSDDPDFEVGGVIGTFKSSELSNDLAKSLAQLKAGEFTSPVNTEGGLRIVRLIKKKIIPDPKLEDEKKRIRSQLGMKGFSKQFEIWLQALRTDAFIKINK